MPRVSVVNLVERRISVCFVTDSWDVTVGTSECFVINFQSLTRGVTVVTLHSVIVYSFLNSIIKRNFM